MHLLSGEHAKPKIDVNIFNRTRFHFFMPNCVFDILLSVLSYYVQCFISKWTLR